MYVQYVCNIFLATGVNAQFIFEFILLGMHTWNLAFFPFTVAISWLLDHVQYVYVCGFEVISFALVQVLLPVLQDPDRPIHPHAPTVQHIPVRTVLLICPHSIR